MEWFPQTRIVFLAHDLRAFVTPFVRRLLGKVTVLQLCRIQGKDVAEFLSDLNVAADLIKTKKCEGCTGGSCGLSTD